MSELVIPHIVFLSFDYPTHAGGSGVGNQTRLLARALVERTYKVSVISLPTGSHNNRYTDEGIEVYEIYPPQWHGYISRIPLIGDWFALAFRELEYGWAAMKKLRQIHYDTPISLIESTEIGNFPLSFQCNKFPYFIRLHGDRYTFFKYSAVKKIPFAIKLCRLIQRIGLRKAIALVSPSSEHAKEIAEELNIPSADINIISNAIELITLKNQMTDVPLQRRSTILYVGRLEETKGIFLLLDSMSDLLSKYPDLSFHLAGSINNELVQKKIERFISDNHLDGKVKLLGYVPWQALMRHYQRALFLVVPSYYETFGLTALEAMACGLPVVANRVGIMPELIKPKKNGYLADEKKPEAFTQAMIAMCEAIYSGKVDPEYIMRSVESFDISIMIMKNLAFYQSMMAGQQKGKG